MSDHFPREIWLEILHKLPVKSLVKCSVVCRAWKSLITDHAFICDLLTHTIQASNNNASLFLQLYTAKREHFFSLYSDKEDETENLPILRLPFPHLIRRHGYSTVVGTCNGLVCFADYSVLDIADHIIWNPCIRKYLVLPKASKVVWTDPRLEGMHGVIYGFGFDSRNKDFKLVRLVSLRGKEGTPQVAEVYSLAAGSWRSITEKAPPFLFSKHFWDARCTSQMFLKGVLHWVVKRTSNGQSYNFVLTFDVNEETFGELMLPQCLRESPFSVSVLTGGDCDSLAVFHTNDSRFEDKFFSVWVMRRYGDAKSWTQVFHSDATQYGGRDISSVLAIRSSGEVVLKSSRDGIVLLDAMKESAKKLGLRGYFNGFVGDHVQSLFLINEERGVLSC